MADVWAKGLDAKGKIVDTVVGRDAKGWKNCGVAAADLSDLVLLMEQRTQKKAGGTMETKFEATFIKAPPLLMGQKITMPTYDDISARMELAGQ